MRYLLNVSIGPVQSFIAASRKTRDLWAGSELLLHVVRTTLKELLRQPGASAIFPAVSSSGGADSADAANIILAEVGAEGEDALRAIVEKLRERAARALAEAFEDAAAYCRGKGLEPDLKLGRRQAEQFVEVYAGWSPLGESYRTARERAESNLAASKSVRRFEPYPTSEGRPKSPLDPALESVIPLGENWRVRTDWQEKLLLKPREHLDAVSLAKRFWQREYKASEPEFPSTRQVALEPVLRLTQGSPELNRITEFCAGVRGGQKQLGPADAIFGFFDELIEPDQTKRSEQIRTGMSLRREFIRVHLSGREPRGYYAVIHADGDGMGKALGGIADQPGGLARHRAFSKQLGAEFASKVRPLVEKHLGALVYAGGDDVLALCPCETAVGLAADIEQLFKQAMEQYGVTLTTAVGYCPIQDDLQESVRFAASLERVGKRHFGGEKNALVVGARVRGGNDVHAAFKWRTAPDQLFADVVNAFDRGVMPRGFPYEIENLANEFRPERFCVEKWDVGVLETAGAEYARIARRKESADKDALAALLPAWVEDWDGFYQFARALALGHFMSRQGAKLGDAIAAA